MKSQLKHCELIVKKSPRHGYGVYTNQDIAKDEVIEECHIIKTVEKLFELQLYLFKAQDKFALALGYGSIYNHSITPNADFFYDADRELIVIRAKRPIKKGEEILIYYGDTWFSGRNMPVIESKMHALRRHFITLAPLIFRFLVVLALLVLFLLVVPLKFFAK